MVLSERVKNYFYNKYFTFERCPPSNTTNVQQSLFSIIKDLGHRNMYFKHHTQCYGILWHFFHHFETISLHIFEISFVSCLSLAVITAIGLS